jgi:hypothetical protein
MMMMMNVAGRTVVASIHQPRSSIYQAMDFLFLLSEVRRG